MACLPCITATDHCHGTLIMHADGVIDCTDDDCYSHDRMRHGFVADCFDLAGGCGCTEVTAKQMRA